VKENQKMAAESYEVVVVGLGAYGSATLMHLAKMGVRVIGIDQFSPPHEMGSSHGETRITRESIAEGQEYIQCVQRSHELWRELEAEAHVSILNRCGGIIVETDPAAVMHGVKGFARTTADLAQKNNIPHEVFNGREGKLRFPGFAPDDDALVYYEPGAGFVRPEVAIEAQLRLAQIHGATIQTETPVLQLERLTGGGVRICTARGEIEAGACLLTAGAWIRKFLPPTQCSTISLSRQVLHWLPIASSSYQLDTSPIFIWTFGAGADVHLYGFPSIDGATVKIAAGTNAEEVSSVAEVDRLVTVAEQERFYHDHIVGRFPLVSGPPVRSKVCLYTNVPEARFIIEHHPDIPECLVASCCSGHGFKHSAGVGEALAATLRGVKPRIDLSVFARPEWRS
jgi:sarcosine oxidase